MVRNHMIVICATDSWLSRNIRWSELERHHILVSCATNSLLRLVILVRICIFILEGNFILVKTAKPTTSRGMFVHAAGKPHSHKESKKEFRDVSNFKSPWESILVKNLTLVYTGRRFQETCLSTLERNHLLVICVKNSLFRPVILIPLIADPRGHNLTLKT